MVNEGFKGWNQKVADFRYQFYYLLAVNVRQEIYLPLFLVSRMKNDISNYSRAWDEYKLSQYR